MSQKLALVAAAAIATVQAKGFCATLGGANICSEQIEAALESEKISISGCVTVGGVQICGNNEETGLFEEEQQGFCVSYNGFQVCKEEVDAALESEKINITGCVTISGVQICKNSEEQQGLGKFIKKVGKVAQVVGPLVLEEESEVEAQGKFWKKVGNVLKKVAQNANISVSLEEESEMESEQGKFWKKLGKALKKIIQNVNVSVTLDEDEQEAVRTTFNQIKHIKPHILRQVLEEDEMELVEQNFLQDPKFWKNTWKVTKVVGKIALHVVPLFLEEDADAEQFFVPGSISPVPLPQIPVLHEEEFEQKVNNYRKLNKFNKKLPQQHTKPAPHHPEVSLQPKHHPKWSKLTPEQRKAKMEKWSKMTPEEKKAKIEKYKAKHAERRAKWSKMTKEERKAKRAEIKAKRAAKKDAVKALEEEEEQGWGVQVSIPLEEQQQRRLRPHHKPIKPTKQAPVAALLEEEQGFCVSYNGFQVCKEQIEAALESEKISISGCVTVGGAKVCANNEETGLFEEEQGFCVEWKGIKVCKEQIEAAMESFEQQGITWSACATINGVSICKQ